MSRSPRRNLRMALDALDDLMAVIEQHGDARAELVERIGEDGVREVVAARGALARALGRIEGSEHPAQAHPRTDSGAD